MTQSPARLLILACGNMLRGDDGVGPHLAAWAEQKFRGQLGIRVISRQQWTPELAEEIAAAESILFIDCSTIAPPGTISLRPIEATGDAAPPGTHSLGAPQLFALARELYGTQPRAALLLTIGAGSIELSEEFSAPVNAVLPQAHRILEKTVARLLA